MKDNHALSLSTVPTGSRVSILCVSEVVEDEEALILYMHEKGLTPGIQLLVTSRDSEANPSVSSQEPESEEVKLLVANHVVTISEAAAVKLWVTLVE